MAQRDPNLFSKELIEYGSEIVTYLWVIGISAWGGAVSFFKRREKTWAKFIVHIFSSSFVGMLTYLLCEYANMPGPLKGAFVGLAGYMGTEAIKKLKIFNLIMNEEGK